jgi:ABC-2 type transport system ATP-binding protein
VNALSIHGLAKRFGDVQAVSDVSFEVTEGELFGFLGPDGAGNPCP